MHPQVVLRETAQASIEGDIRATGTDRLNPFDAATKFLLRVPSHGSPALFAVFCGILFAGTDFDTAVDINAIWQDRLNRLLNVSRIQPSG